MVKMLKNNPLSRYLAECVKEYKKVVWPSKETVQKHTILVVSISLAIAIYFGVLDYLLNLGLQYLLSL